MDCQGDCQLFPKDSRVSWLEEAVIGAGSAKIVTAYIGDSVNASVTMVEKDHAPERLLQRIKWYLRRQVKV
jgi:hypothetical protein